MAEAREQVLRMSGVVVVKISGRENREGKDKREFNLFEEQPRIQWGWSGAKGRVVSD